MKFYVWTVFDTDSDDSDDIRMVEAASPQDAMQQYMAEDGRDNPDWWKENKGARLGIVSAKHVRRVKPVQQFSFEPDDMEDYVKSEIADEEK